MALYVFLFCTEKGLTLDYYLHISKKVIFMQPFTKMHHVVYEQSLEYWYLYLHRLPQSPDTRYLLLAGPGSRNHGLSVNEESRGGSG